MIEVQIFPLVSNLALPVAAPEGTRLPVPSGYGIQEHCLPFTAATALGFLIKSPISFGICPPGEVPAGGHAFRSPLINSSRIENSADEAVFYVKDDPKCGFVKNAFTMDVLEEKRMAPQQPGIGFFDREDQLDVFKLHLPYIWRTPAEVDALFLSALNRAAVGLDVLAGLVEADWYANQVNLVFRQPDAGHSVHIAVGDPVAQVIFLPRSHRRPTLTVLPPPARVARDLRANLVEWYEQHAADRSAYKKLARSQHGRIHTESQS